MYEERAKQTFVSFLQQTADNSRLKNLCVEYMMQIHKVIDRIQHYVMMNRERKQEMVDMWEEQKTEILDYYKTKKHKSQKFTKMRRQLLKVPDELRDTVLRLYMDRCKNKHTIAFYKWRETYSINTRELVKKYIQRLKLRIEQEQQYLEEGVDDQVGDELDDIDQMSTLFPKFLTYPI